MTKEDKIKKLEEQLRSLGFDEKGRTLSFLKAELKRRLKPNWVPRNLKPDWEVNAMIGPKTIKKQTNKAKRNHKLQYKEIVDKVKSFGVIEKDLASSFRGLKKQLKKLEAQSNPDKTPKEKKQKLLKFKKEKVTNKPYVKITIPNLSRNVTRVKRYLYIQSLLKGSWASYMNIKAALITAKIISAKDKDKNVDPIIDQYIKLFKFVGLKTTEPELFNKILQLQAKRKSTNKHYKNDENGPTLCSVIDRKDAKSKKKKLHPEKAIKYKWKRLEAEVNIDKAKPPIWISNNLISQVEEKHHFISTVYREISDGSTQLDFYLMKFTLELVGIITESTRNSSQIVEKYIVFYSFIGLYTGADKLDAKISDFEKHQIKMQEELMKEKEEQMEFYEIADILNYFKRDPKKISVDIVLEFLRVIKTWERNISNIDSQKDIVISFLSQLQALIANITILATVNRDSTNYGKIIHLVKKLNKTKKPVITKQAV